MRDTVFLFANQGHGTIAVKAALRSDAEVVGVCSEAPPQLTLRNRVGRLRGIFRQRRAPNRDPFASFPHPRKLASPWFPASDLAGVQQYLEATKPDFIITCSFRKLIPNAILACAKYAAINVHPGLLPERGGGTPNRWAIREGDSETGVTAHLMTDKWDHGHHVWQRRIPIRPDATWGEVELSLTPLIRDAVQFLLRGQEEDYTATKDYVGVATSDPSFVPPAPRLQKSYRGEPFTGQTREECQRICRAVLPKGCGFREKDCNRGHCGL